LGLVQAQARASVLVGAASEPVALVSAQAVSVVWASAPVSAALELVVLAWVPDSARVSAQVPG